MGVSGKLTGLEQRREEEGGGEQGGARPSPHYPATPVGFTLSSVGMESKAAERRAGEARLPLPTTLSPPSASAAPKHRLGGATPTPGTRLSSAS